jgi:ABC-type antimicrobial peptide transport system permease subunit
LPADAAPVDVAPFKEILDFGTLPIILALLSCFSVLGIVVAGLGVYATATLMSAARTREMGIRLAIGASAEHVAGMTLWRSLRMALIALPFGLAGAWGLSRYLAHWLFQVGVNDPVSFVASAGILLVISVLAGLWPALRAATTDPSTALRYDG